MFLDNRCGSVPSSDNYGYGSRFSTTRSIVHQSTFSPRVHQFWKGFSTGSSENEKTKDNTKKKSSNTFPHSPTSKQREVSHNGTELYPSHPPYIIGSTSLHRAPKKTQSHKNHRERGRRRIRDQESRDPLDTYPAPSPQGLCKSACSVCKMESSRRDRSVARFIRDIQQNI